MTIRTATKIIKKDISDNIFNNIINVTNLKEMWEKFCSMCFQVSQEIVYLIPQKVFNYFHNTKLKEFKKLVISQFANVNFLLK